MSRLETLQQYIKDDPQDPFNHYALALELLKTDPDQAYREFKLLISRSPDYLPTYYPFAKLLIERKETEEALKIFETAMRTARKLQDHKTLRELQALKRDWEEGLE